MRGDQDHGSEKKGKFLSGGGIVGSGATREESVGLGINIIWRQ